MQDLLTNRIVWFIRNLDLSGGLAPVVARYRDGVAAVRGRPAEGARRRRAGGDRRPAPRNSTGLGMAQAQARRLASLAALVSAPDIVRVAEASGRPVEDVAATHFALEHAFRLDALAAAARTVPVADTFDRVALERAVAGIAAAHRKLTAEVVADLGAGPGGGGGLGEGPRRAARPDPRGGRRDRRLRPHGLQGDGGGEPARRSRPERIDPVEAPGGGGREHSPRPLRLTAVRTKPSPTSDTAAAISGSWP